MNIEQLPPPAFTQSETTDIARYKLRLEKNRRERNTHDELIERRRMERALLDGLYGPKDAA